KKISEVVAEEYRACWVAYDTCPQIEEKDSNQDGAKIWAALKSDANFTSEMLCRLCMDVLQGKNIGANKIPGSSRNIVLVQVRTKAVQDNGLLYPGNNIYYHLIPWKTGIKCSGCNGLLQRDSF
ncbi:MAG: hypothetical protein IPH69_01835, partial [Bacteroidales bacterium]|nr:hypothetical protein [Bacteroidales bacterium]